MPIPPTEQIAQLEAAIAALDAQRQTLGDAVVDASLAPLRAQLAALRLRTASSAAAQTTSLERQLMHLNQADLIRPYTSAPELTYIFKHALTQESAYESLLVNKRREIHRLVAQVYEQLYAPQLYAARGNIGAAQQQMGRAAAQFAESGCEAELALTRSLLANLNSAALAPASIIRRASKI